MWKPGCRRNGRRLLVRRRRRLIGCGRLGGRGGGGIGVGDLRVVSLNRQRGSAKSNQDLYGAKCEDAVRAGRDRKARKEQKGHLTTIAWVLHSRCNHDGLTANNENSPQSLPHQSSKHPFSNPIQEPPIPKTIPRDRTIPKHIQLVSGQKRSQRMTKESFM